jgi:tRNA-modifying protein YgfZ
VQTGRVSFWCEYPRDVLQVSGPDAAAYLQSQVSQELRPLAVGASAWTFVLQPAGRIDVLARVWRTADDVFVLDTDAGYGDVLAARLARFMIRVKADVTPLAWRCLAVRGEGAGELHGLASWGEGADLLGPDPQPPDDVVAGSADELLAARIDAVWPQMGAEIVPGETIPAETGITDVAVSFTKGCYPGQELVERMDSRGAAAPRRLQRVRLVERVGEITSSAGEWALAYVKRAAAGV